MDLVAKGDHRMDGLNQQSSNLSKKNGVNYSSFFTAYYTEEMTGSPGSYTSDYSDEVDAYDQSHVAGVASMQRRNAYRGGDRGDAGRHNFEKHSRRL